MLQGHAIQELHGDEGLAFVLANVMDGADVGMVQRRRGLCFALETRQGLRIVGEFLGQEFQGHEAVQARVFGLVHHTHAAAAELFDDPIM